MSHNSKYCKKSLKGNTVESKNLLLLFKKIAQKSNDTETSKAGEESNDTETSKGSDDSITTGSTAAADEFSSSLLLIPH